MSITLSPRGYVLALCAGWLASAAMLTSCSVGPSYRLVTPTVSESFASAAGHSNTNGLAWLSWWTGFQDPLLNRVMALAVTNNHDLHRAEARLREARALWTQARFDVAPTVRAEAGFDKTKLSKDAAGTKDRRSELYRAGFDATWELDLWGAVRRNIEAAKATVESVEATREDALILVRAEVAVNYFELRGAQARLAVSTRNATNQSQTLSLAVALRDGGQGTQLDVARAKSLLNETFASIPPLQASVQRGVHRISVLCGMPPATLGPELLPVVPLPTIPQGLVLTDPAAMLRGRPDVRAAERALAASTARVGLETASLFPRVTVSGSFGFQASEVSRLTQVDANTYGFGPRISWAAFDLGRVRQRIKAAGARSEQALATYQETVLLALEEAENSLVNLGRERERLGFLAEAERSASEAVALARQRYADGIADYLSVLDAERTLLNLQDQLVSAETVRATSLISVYKAFAAGAAVSR